MSANPILVMTSDPGEIFPLLELKQHLVLYLETPPGPKTARVAYDLYMDRFGGHVAKYRSTSPGDLLRDWTPAARRTFEDLELPALRTKDDWGYRFWDGRGVNSWQFLFHGSRPASQPQLASVFRFEFPWNISTSALFEFSYALLERVTCLSGSAGYHFQGRALSKYENLSYDRMFALAHRYWGVEAQNLDVTLQHARHGYKCANWLTIIGKALGQSDPEAVERARASAFTVAETPHATLLQAEERPRLIDRNRRETLGRYTAVAEALLPLQVKEHAPFGGDRWDEDNTTRYLRRFSHPDEV